MSAERATSELTVAILPLGNVSSRQINFTAIVLEEKFGVKTMVLPAMKIPAQYFNAERGRYQARQILDLLFSQLPTRAQRIMGIIDGKIEKNDNKSCLGLADSYKMAALYSVAHFSTSQSGQAGHDNDILSYLSITHEFVHTLGLAHCSQPDCVMKEVPNTLVLCARCCLWVDRELKVKPDSAEERFSRAESLLLHDCVAQAIALYRQAISRAQHEPLYHNRLGMALQWAGQSDKAIQEMKLAAVFSNENSDDLYYNFGVSYLSVKLERAEEFFTKAIATAKDPKFTHRIIGQAYREILHDVERASRHYKEYLRLGGKDPDVVDWLISRSQLDQP